jgi:hypothetical protein
VREEGESTGERSGRGEGRGRLKHNTSEGNDRENEKENESESLGNKKMKKNVNEEDKKYRSAPFSVQRSVATSSTRGLVHGGESLCMGGQGGGALPEHF